MTQIKIIKDGVTLYDAMTDFAFCVAHAVGEPSNRFLQYCEADAPRKIVFDGVLNIGDAIKRLGNPALSMAAIAAVVGGTDGTDIDLTGMIALQHFLEERDRENKEGEGNDQED